VLTHVATEPGIAGVASPNAGTSQAQQEPGRPGGCESPIFAVPSRGQDTFLVRDGQIHRLETTLLAPPVIRESEA
jgi:hypothetical protein